jgi:alkylhydroperoxidase family enzyme
MISIVTVSAWSALTAAEVRALAPDAIESFEQVLAAASALAERSPVIELARRRMTSRLSGEPEPATAGTDPSDGDRACLEVAEQFVLDVARVGEADRVRLAAILGNGTFEFVQALYAFDHGWRVQAVTRQLFGCEVLGDIAVAAGTDLWRALERMMTAVVVLDALDPLTSELVRLRGARAHQCRVCTSRRMAPVVAAHGSDVLEQTEVDDLAALGEPTAAALRLTDAILWQPDAVPVSTLEQVRAALTPAEALEVVLDVARNASNKIAVALGADAASVADGVEYFDVSAAGDYTYGLPAPQPG